MIDPSLSKTAVCPHLQKTWIWFSDRCVIALTILFTEFECSHYVPVVTYEPVQIGLKFEVRVEHLTARDALISTCRQCHKRFTVAPHVLFARYHPGRRLIDVCKEMRCRRCGNAGDFSWYVVRAKGPEFPRIA
ncbi:hypothetical protein AADZ90_021450 [Aestuariibius sp. 2305UL40-4]|uniref:hypothetical protein n=1 Tax=Aestuariibius violaceus TaxID=3234132 RepID=UPI00345E8D4A